MKNRINNEKGYAMISVAIAVCTAVAIYIAVTNSNTLSTLLRLNSYQRGLISQPAMKPLAQTLQDSILRAQNLDSAVIDAAITGAGTSAATNSVILDAPGQCPGGSQLVAFAPNSLGERVYACVPDQALCGGSITNNCIKLEGSATLGFNLSPEKDNYILSSAFSIKFMVKKSYQKKIKLLYELFLNQVLAGGSDLPDISSFGSKTPKVNTPTCDGASPDPSCMNCAAGKQCLKIKICPATRSSCSSAEHYTYRTYVVEKRAPASFTGTASLSMPLQIFRGPGQQVNVPNRLDDPPPGGVCNSETPCAPTQGIKISLSTSEEVKSFDFEIISNPTYLNLLDAKKLRAVPQSASMRVNREIISGGLVKLSISVKSEEKITSMAEELPVLSVFGSVPCSAPYKGTQNVTLNLLKINGVSQSTAPVIAKHTVGFVGDANADGMINGSDLGRVARVVSGFATLASMVLWPASEQIVATDLDNSNTLNATDINLLGTFYRSNFVYIKAMGLPAVPNCGGYMQVAQFMYTDPPTSATVVPSTSPPVPAPNTVDTCVGGLPLDQRLDCRINASWSFETDGRVKDLTYSECNTGYNKVPSNGTCAPAVLCKDGTHFPCSSGNTQNVACNFQCVKIVP